MNPTLSLFGLFAKSKRANTRFFPVSSDTRGSRRKMRSVNLYRRAYRRVCLHIIWTKLLEDVHYKGQTLSHRTRAKWTNRAYSCEKKYDMFVFSLRITMKEPIRNSLYAWWNMSQIDGGNSNPMFSLCKYYLYMERDLDHFNAANPIHLLYNTRNGWE